MWGKLAVILIRDQSQLNWAFFLIMYTFLHPQVCQSRAVKKFLLSSKLIMNSRQLWNSPQRHKFLRAEATRYILIFRSSEMAFPGVFKSFFPPQTPCCQVIIHAGLGTMLSRCPRCSTASHGSSVSLHDLNLFKFAFNVNKNWETDALQFYSMVLFFVSSCGRRR